MLGVRGQPVPGRYDPLLWGPLGPLYHSAIHCLGICQWPLLCLLLPRMIPPWVSPP